MVTGCSLVTLTIWLQCVLTGCSLVSLTICLQCLCVYRVFSDYTDHLVTLWLHCYRVFSDYTDHLVTMFVWLQDVLWLHWIIALFVWLQGVPWLHCLCGYRVFSAYIKDCEPKPSATNWGKKMIFANLMAEFSNGGGKLLQSICPESHALEQVKGHSRVQPCQLTSLAYLSGKPCPQKS